MEQATYPCVICRINSLLRCEVRLQSQVGAARARVELNRVVSSNIKCENNADLTKTFVLG